MMAQGGKEAMLTGGWDCRKLARGSTKSRKDDPALRPAGRDTDPPRDGLLRCLRIYEVEE
jgi:hypothetical protein